MINDYPVNIQIYNRVLKFVNNCLNSDNQCVKLWVNLALNGCNSNMCKNMNQIACDYKCDKYSLLNRGLMNKDCHYSFIILELSNCVNIIDLLHIWENNSNNFTLAEINQLTRHFTVRLHINQYWSKLGSPVKLHANKYTGLAWGCMMFVLSVLYTWLSRCISRKIIDMSINISFYVWVYTIINQWADSSRSYIFVFSLILLYYKIYIW